MTNTNKNIIDFIIRYDERVDSITHIETIGVDTQLTIEEIRSYLQRAIDTLWQTQIQLAVNQAVSVIPKNITETELEQEKEHEEDS